MDIETKLDLIMRPPTEEVITEQDLRQRLETVEHPKHYIGFEISGLLHLGTLILSGYKVNDLADAGVDVTIYLADWHSFINRKLGGDWENIIKASKYFEEGFRFFCPRAKIVLGSDLYHNNDDYWRDIIRFSSNMTIARASRCLTIMGRSEKERLSLAQYFYPPMQGVDIKYLGKDIPHGGMDQRKVHVLAKEIYPKLGWEEPIPLHHHLLMGLAKPPEIKTENKAEKVEAAKMSKSKPWTAIFIHDSEQQIRDKLIRAWCPERRAEFNPVLELAKYIIFHDRKEFLIEREGRYGGDITFSSYEELERAYTKGSVHPKDLKLSVAREISKIIDPIRKHFEQPSNKKLLEVFQKVSSTE
ncbi:MAG: tyrosine--tRNA ligase [Thermoproteota archaeon]